MHSRLCKGFTLVELLVVIAIIGVLVALLLPAVQAAREAARRMQCTNNLKQIGLALANYEVAVQTYPPGAFWRYPPDSNPIKGSVLLHILPFIEQQNIYDQFDFKQFNLEKQTTPVAFSTIAATRIPSYVCPSDDAPKTGITNYGASRGPTRVENNPVASCTHPYSSFAMNASSDDIKKIPGVFSRMGCEPDVATTIGQVTDGLSNTIFFGEVRPKCSTHFSAGWARSNSGQGYCTTIIPLNYDSCDRTATKPACAQYNNWNTEVGFKSSHPGGVYVLLGDGSVHFLTDNIDHQLLQYLGAKGDGRTINLPF